MMETFERWADRIFSAALVVAIGSVFMVGLISVLGKLLDGPRAEPAPDTRKYVACSAFRETSKDYWECDLWSDGARKQ